MTKQKNGFSMMESVVSIALMSLGVVAVIGFISSGMRETNDSRNQAVAALLAQEGVELVRNLRDSNWSGGTGGSFYNFPINGADDCVIYYNHVTSTAIICGASIDKYLALSSGFYNSNTAGRYQRKIIVAYSGTAVPPLTKDTADEAEITSVVVWGSDFPTVSIDATSCNATSKCSYAKTTLSKWRR